MAIALSYFGNTESWICMTLQTGDTLAASGGAPAVNGPATLFFPVDGQNNYYKQTVAQGLVPSASHPTRPPKPV